MDDLGDDSVQLVVRISRETFEMWMRRPKEDGRPQEKRVAADLARSIEDGDSRIAVASEAEECGWQQITLASSDLEGIQARLNERGVVFQANERLDGDIDVYFQAYDEEAIKEALADIIANEALVQEDQQLDMQDLDESELEGYEIEQLEECEHEPIEDQIEQAKQSEASREGARAEEAKLRTMSQDIER